jgi:two-component system nitrogen regulation response regulator GlnG
MVPSAVMPGRGPDSPDSPDSLDAGATEPLVASPREVGRRLRVVVVAGPDRGKALPLTRGAHRIGKHPSCDLVLADGTVSAQHLAIDVEPGRLAVRDLGSTNGSFYAGARFDQIEVSRGASFTIGKSELRIEAVDAATSLPPSASERLGELVGRSEAMRRLFTLLERAARSPASVLIEGETGTGKELVARALHDGSPRAAGPLVVCDLGSITASLCESELFGHVRGAFTGADRDRAGAFEQADGGTIFLDEIGELPLELQPRLLRALESRQVRRVGDGGYRDVDVRVVAATNRDLAAEVRAGHFRADLYHRLSIVMVHLPPLRERAEDVALLVEHRLRATGATGGVHPAVLRALAEHDWPGNVRELENVLERALALGIDLADAGAATALLGGGGSGDRIVASAPPVAGAAAIDPTVPFRDAKSRLVDAWERDYVVALLASCDGNVSLAARRAGMDRAYLHRLLRKHGLG